MTEHSAMQLFGCGDDLPTDGIILDIIPDPLIWIELW